MKIKILYNMCIYIYVYTSSSSDENMVATGQLLHAAGRMDLWPGCVSTLAVSICGLSQEN